MHDRFLNLDHCLTASIVQYNFAMVLKSTYIINMSLYPSNVKLN